MSDTKRRFDMKFSIIIPIYKVEPYLRKCVESVLSQTYEEYEIILVDDGSPDDCPALCDKLVSEDARIRVIHKQNGGLSSARNEGLNCASGDYVVFLDGDDYWCDHNLLQQLADRVESFEEEVVLFGCKIVKNDGSEEVSRNDYDTNILNRHNKAESLRYLYGSGKIPGAAWILTVKKSLVDKLTLSFRNGVTAEDYEWVITLLSECNAVGAIEGVHYAYIRREGSITTSAKLSGIRGIMYAIDTYIVRCKDNKDACELNPFVCRMYLLALMAYGSLPASEKNDGAKLLKKYLPFVKEQKPLYYCIVCTLGFFLTSKMIRLAYNIVR